MSEQPTLSQSLKFAVSSYKHVYMVLGMVVTIVATLNFLYGLVAFPLAPILGQMLTTYVAIVHGALDWITWPFGVRIPGAIKDALFIYGLVGGAFARARVQEGIYGRASAPIPLHTVLKVLVWPERSHGGIVVPGSRGVSMGSRVKVAYSVSPGWLRWLIDFLLWPRVAGQYWQAPMVYFHEYGGTHQSFAAGYRPGGRKTFMHDRRIIFFVHIAFIVLAVVAILIVNGFLAPPSSLMPG